MPERHNPSMPDKPWHIDTARTMVVNTVVVLELFYLFSVRYLYGASLTWRGVLGTPAVLLGISVIVGLQLAFTYIPYPPGAFSYLRPGAARLEIGTA